MSFPLDLGQPGDLLEHPARQRRRSSGPSRAGCAPRRRSRGRTLGDVRGADEQPSSQPSSACRHGPPSASTPNRWPGAGCLSMSMKQSSWTNMKSGSISGSIARQSPTRHASRSPFGSPQSAQAAIGFTDHRVDQLRPALVAQLRARSAAARRASVSPSPDLTSSFARFRPARCRCSSPTSFTRPSVRVSGQKVVVRTSATARGGLCPSRGPDAPSSRPEIVETRRYCCPRPPTKGEAWRRTVEQTSPGTAR